MGHKHSKRPKRPNPPPEVTEIIELNDNQSEVDDDSQIAVSDESKPSEQIVYPFELEQVLDAVELIEKSIEVMTASQMDLYYATLKDDLHNQWQKLYELADHGEEAIKLKKVEAIERVKTTLKRLSAKVLMKGHAVHN